MHALRPRRAVELPDVVPGRRDPAAETLEQVGTVGADVARRVDREAPQVTVPLVARVARAHGVGRLVGDERVVDLAVEREQRAGRHDLADVRVVVDQQVVALREVGDRGIGEALQRTDVPGDRHAPLGAEPRRGREQGVDAPLVAPGDAAQAGGHAATQRGSASPARAACCRWAVAV